VKDEAIELFFARPVDDAFHKECGNAAPAPLRFGKYI
jgi:hypothetical protein